MMCHYLGYPIPEVMHMTKRTHTQHVCFRLEPEKRLCPTTDSASIRTYRLAAPGEMGFRVVDDFCQEHIQ